MFMVASQIFYVQEILMVLATPKFPPIYKVKPGNGPVAWQRHFIEEKARMLDLQLRAEAFQSKVAAERVKRKFGGKIETDLTIFPTKEMAKVCFFNIPVIPL